jgi:hypothetical protein
MPNLTVTWAPLRHLVLRVTVAEFTPDSALKRIQARNATCVNAQAAMKF